MKKRKTQQKIDELEKQIGMDQMIIEAWRRSANSWEELAKLYKSKLN